MIDETGKVTFTPEEQNEVDRIIGERLSRAKTEKPADYDDLKEIESEIGEFFEGTTPAEKKAAIKAYKAEVKAQNELAELERQAKATGKDPDLLLAIQKLEKKIESLEGVSQAAKLAEESKKKADEAINKQITEMQEAHPDIDLKILSDDPKFIKFAKGKNIPLKELYEDFVDFIGETEAETIAKVKSKQERSTGSGKGNSSPGGSYGLTDNQKNLAKENGMTEKQYAEFLSHVK